jgi:hypothetical protein
MSQALIESPHTVDEESLERLAKAVENIVTEDGEPVGNIFSAKQQTLLKRTLYSSWTPPAEESADRSGGPRPFLADVNVGVFISPYQPPLVPDFFLSLDVEPREGWQAKKHRSYFVWEFGKAPEVAVEVVSNREGDELTRKLRGYARMGVLYYVVYDPWRQLGDRQLHAFALRDGEYQPLAEAYLPRVGLGLTLWQGTFEDWPETWLRWLDREGNLIPLGQERAAQAEAELQQAEAELQQAEAALQAEAAARKAAEEQAARAAAEAERLREELERLRRQSPPEE